MKHSRLQYGDALRAGRRAGAEFDLFIDSMQDQVVFLGYDLNPTAVQSLEEDAAKLNQQANQLFQEVDEVVKKINDYIRSLRPQ